MKIKTIKIALLMALGTASFTANAQHVIGTVRGIDIKADTDARGGLEGIRMYAANKKLADFNPSNNIFHVLSFFQKGLITNDVSRFYAETHFHRNTNVYGAFSVSGNTTHWSNVGIGINPAAGLHVKNKHVRVDGGEYQSWGAVVLHPDVDNNGDDIISFRNSTNQEMAKIHDGVLTLNGGNTIQSPGSLTLRPDTNNSGDDFIAFKNSANAEMARLQDGVLTLDQVRLNVSTFPDYVFAKEYKLMPLLKVAQFIKKYKHLPNMPTEKEVVAQGMNVGQINTLLVEKVEELTLYTIDQETKISKQEKAIENLTARLEALEKLLKSKE
ncbi:exported hypothetical protein [Tenacibaculum litopenaei]|uniref:hypothetical protein n=1 Tax=Tenacibaculum litopenaei TaxID=396016 RepID=UPI003895157B